jgi:cyclic pyranopterin monophosphate synthase
MRAEPTRPAALTHVDEHGAARMVDVSGKAVTSRTARAAGRFETTPLVIDLLRRDGLPKGDALAVARIAGIAAAKRTPDLVPLCHPIALHGVTVELELTQDAVQIVATTRTADRTGVEMEALTSVVVTGLALYDMVKALDRGARLTDVRLLAKSGGRSGDWTDEPARRAEQPGPDVLPDEHAGAGPGSGEGAAEQGESGRRSDERAAEDLR